MRLKYSLALALLLSGCQMTSPDSTTSTPETNKSELAAKQKAAKEQAKSKQSLTDAVKETPKVLSPQEQEDVWQRIAMQLEMDIPHNKKVDYYRTWYLKHPNHLKTVSQRAEPFLYMIAEQIEKRGLPMELALLPVVESSFDAFAYSHGSAAGLWQFVPGTGKMMGLEQNYWYDGRRDVAASTEAALDYLVQLNKQFDGNWEHAIAAYNSGGGRVSRAIRKNKSLGKPIDFFSLDLPKETSSYLPKLLALADVVANQDKYGLNIPAIPNKPVLALVDPKEQLDLAIAADYAGIGVKELQSYNPAYNQWSTSPNGPQKLLIPIEKKDAFLAQVAENRGKGVKVARYKVKSGDSLGVLARKYGTTTKVIRRANGLSSDNIRIGQHLLIPTSTKDDSKYALSASNRLSKTQSTARGQLKLTHVVQSGESLWSIARDNNVSYKSLAKWNGMGPKDTLRKGQKIVIWKKSADDSVIRTVFYNVRSGDTISGIASKFKVKSTDIVKWNSLQQKKYLQPGQKLKLYVDVTKVSV
ncbi:LysM peptidoglycan-binding domain-containing protein [Vibrio natriegens]|uniref:Lytic transglycosylase n=1 Tax=Vibrio natriegens NBRC 15636 = ATCC 14048 = DSM 759 TaxID=1219067 RepID=A0AAN0Y3P0_VIBNA|nr:LysM peptidoglycan-binding domain-containing protein [Vibrio natriegens]ALR14877.1 murein transglycosylase [Vibrio natriegens NBRC 15636 = ATCC 14048 = DSM 759]ANQ13259.1 lytic transglycosylase [Vibrio natriegens NBRC 15636 = ATCC 14048 = DSM 759]EPM39908.1 murein transglycosylase [Vibrio natriegens NBRC 15636 = ATCC 14048 = DSM 759]MDX6027689.1 LysM peptidoglycan-binding domain-containing protein [Vibrio natriegens NBRC 15636 = ATCC 14048 = DSM 759]UUI10999.1 LysM peptidoglycan-binding dom